MPFLSFLKFNSNYLIIFPFRLSRLVRYAGQWEEVFVSHHDHPHHLTIMTITTDIATISLSTARAQDER